MSDVPAKRRFRFPFPVAGAIVGAGLMQTWPGISNDAATAQIVVYVLLGALAGEIIGWLIRLPPASQN
jgi:hypothetical protein